MSVRPSIFGSKQEKDYFEHLVKIWEGEELEVHSNLPFLQVCDFSGLQDFSSVPPKPFTVGSIDRQRLKKTSIDYVLCTKAGKALVALDFDGLQEGFNVGTKYVPTEGDDEWRRLITELKLKVAHGSGLPYLVVRSLHFNIIPTSDLRIVDGLIGCVLSGIDENRRLQAEFRPEDMGLSQEVYGGLGEREKHEVVQDWVIDQGTISELVNNPVIRLAEEWCCEMGIHRFELVPYRPGLGATPADSWRDHGYRVTLWNDDGVQGVGAVMLAHFNTKGLKTDSLTRALAKVAAILDLKKKLEDAAGKGAAK